MLLVRILWREALEMNQKFYQDKRVIHLPMIGSPIPMALIIVAYLTFILKVGPKMMKHREPFNLKMIIQIYNVCQILINLFCFTQAVQIYYKPGGLDVSCGRQDKTDYRPAVMALRTPAYVYFLSKYFDLLDTIFFVLRKKFNQISFLHYYHHSMMVYAVWVYLTLQFSSHFTMLGVVNAFVHMAMYTYYFVAGLNLKIDLLPYKKFITQLQIAQFCYLVFHFLRAILNNYCNADIFWLWTILLQNVFMIILFTDFYIKAYIKKPKKQKLLAAEKSA